MVFRGANSLADDSLTILEPEHFQFRARRSCFFAMPLKPFFLLLRILLDTA